MEKLDNICSFLSGNAWSAAKFCDSPPGIPIVRIQNLGDNENEKKIYWRESFDKKYLVNDGDILLSLSGSIKLYEWKDGEALLNQRIVKITPNKNIDKSYLIFKLSSLVNEITRSGRHALVNNVSINDVKDLEIPVPDLKTQQKISSILEQADAARQKRKQANQLTEQFLQSAFLEMFGDPITNEKRWEKKNVQEVADVLSGFAFKSEEYSSDKDDIKICGGLIVYQDRIDWDKANHWSKLKTKGLEKYLLNEGDIIVAMDRPWISLGFKIAMIKKSDPNSLLIQRTARVRATKINNHYLYFLLSHPAFESHCKPTETTVPHISPKEIMSYKVPIPPLHLQLKFASIVEQVEQLRVKQRESERELENLFNSLMQRYFGT